MGGREGKQAGESGKVTKGEGMQKGPNEARLSQ